MQEELSNLITGISDDILSLDTSPEYNDLSSSDDIILQTLPKTVSVVLDAVTSDDEGKNLLLKGSLNVKQTATDGSGTDNAVFNYVFCDSSDASGIIQSGYCIEE